MRAVPRLLLSFFFATRLTRACALLGLSCVLIGMAGYVFAPEWSITYDVRREYPWLASTVLSLPWLGLLLLLASSAPMPLIVERVARGRSAWLLPHGRAGLLASVILSALLLALLTATAATLAFRGFPADVALSRIFYRTLLMAFVDFGLIYQAIWLVSKTSGVWRLAGLFWVVVSIMIPTRYLAGIPPFSPLEGIGLAAWIVFGALLLSGGQLRRWLSQQRARLGAFGRRLLPGARYAPGDETALLLGTARPWLVAFGQVVPIAILVAAIRDSELWIVILAVFSAIAGAFSSQAGARSRRLWLCSGWTREEISGRVEAAFWRYNGWSLAVLLVLYTGIAVWFGFGPETLWLGLALLVAGCAASMYLGLLITQGLGWFESTLCILTMIGLTLGAIAIMRGSAGLAVEFIVALAGFAVVYRLFARARWRRLDWVRCRQDTALRGAV